MSEEKTSPPKQTNMTLEPYIRSMLDQYVEDIFQATGKKVSNVKFIEQLIEFKGASIVKKMSMKS